MCRCAAGLAATLILCTIASCKREARVPEVLPPYAASMHAVTLTTQRPGPRIHGETEAAHLQWINEYEENAYALSEGKRLYTFFNCNGCHAKGGGGMGVPLMDEQWLYGSEPEQIFLTIIQGRPNGMPAFTGRIPDYQVWQLVAYVRSMSGLVRKDAAPGRDDSIRSRPPEHSTTQQAPKSDKSRSLEMPS